MPFTHRIVDVLVMKQRRIPTNNRFQSLASEKKHGVDPGMLQRQVSTQRVQWKRCKRSPST